MPTEPTELVGTRLILDNDRVRGWELSLARGESLERHIHWIDLDRLCLHH